VSRRLPVGGHRPAHGDEVGPPDDPEPDFRVNDWIRNAQPHDINLRSRPSTSSSIVTSLVPGKLLCVTGAPTSNEGFRWYPVRVTNGGQTGHVAGELCSLKQRNGCGTGPAPGKFNIGDRIIARADLNVRSTPGTGGGVTPTPGMTTSDPLQRAVSRGVPNDAYEHARLRGAHRISEVKAYVAEVYRLCDVVDLDAAILIAQSSQETAAWTSVAWRERLNPAGIGITGPDVPGESFATGVAAARAQVAHMHAYVYGNTRSLPGDLVGADPRYRQVFDSGYAGSVTRIADLAGKWAVDPDYATKIVAHGNAIYGQAVQSTVAAAPESIIDVLSAGTELCVKAGHQIVDGWEWYDIEYSGRRGWVAAEYCDLKRAGGCGGGTGDEFGLGDQIRVFDGPLNYRSAPGLSAAILGSVAQGALLCVTGGPQTADGYTWYRVAEGWVAGEFCELHDRGGCTGAGAFAVNDQVRVFDGPLNIRSAPGLSGAVTAMYGTGDLACIAGGPVASDGYDWYRTADGWIAGEFCELYDRQGCADNPRPPAHYLPGDGLFVVDPPVNVRSGPGVGYPSQGLLEYLAEVCVLDGPEYADGYEWYYVRGGGLTGWVAEPFFGLVGFGYCHTTVDGGAFKPGDVIHVHDGPVNVRTNPSLSGAVLGTFPLWQRLTVLAGPVYADAFEWYEATDGTLTGWIAGIYCSFTASGGSVFNAASLATPAKRVWRSGIQAGDIVRRRWATTIVRASASPSASQVGTLSEGHALTIVTGPPQIGSSGAWLPVEGPFGDGWVSVRDVEKHLEPVNLLASPTADVDLSNISGLNGGAISRETKDGSIAVKCVNSGSSPNQGLRYSSGSLSEAGRRVIVGVVDVMGSGVIDAAKLRVMYSDGSASLYSASAPSVTLSSSAWRRVITPAVASDSTKTISKVELWVRRDSATAQTFWTDNALAAVIDPA
jgi:uncharacterized protein YraI